MHRLLNQLIERNPLTPPPGINLLYNTCSCYLNSASIGTTLQHVPGILVITISFVGTVGQYTRISPRSLIKYRLLLLLHVCKQKNGFWFLVNLSVLILTQHKTYI